MHRRLLESEMKIEKDGVELCEIHHHQGLANEIMQALMTSMNAVHGIPAPMLHEPQQQGWGEGGAVPG